MNTRIIPRSIRGDAEDLIELEQLLSGPHRIISKDDSPFQEVLLLETDNIRMYINQQLQFSSLDEKIYHEALVHPAMTLATKRDRVLIVSGNDGLVLREVLKYSDVKRVCLVECDPDLLRLAKTLPQLTSLNQGAFSDQRVHIHERRLNKFLQGTGKKYDVIIVDFLDPVDNIISKKYRRKVFRGLSKYLTRDGILVCQGYSPEEAPLVFWSIARTLEASGLKTLSYHVNVPTFGDWGFHIASKNTLRWKGDRVTIPNETIPEDLTPWFCFPNKTLEFGKMAKANTKQHLILHKYFAQSVLNGPRISRTNPYIGSNHTVLGDMNDVVELTQILSGSHKILYQGSSREYDFLLVEATDMRMYLDGQLQFSSLDEAIYHEALVHPALNLTPNRKRILIVGGGDGLAMREVLKYSDVNHVDLVDLDPDVLQVADSIKEMVELNKASLHDTRVSIFAQDAQIFVPEHKNLYEVVIVDFPDPSDEVVSRLYTTEFFASMYECLIPGGILVCQSHSPSDAPTTFWSIGLTIESAGLQTLSYHINVPSFGDWGFHLACKHPLSWETAKLSVPLQSLPDDLTPLFQFSKEILSFRQFAEVNSLNTLNLHKIYASEVGTN